MSPPSLVAGDPGLGVPWSDGSGEPVQIDELAESSVDVGLTGAGRESPGGA